MAVAGYELRVNGGTLVNEIIDVGNVLEYDLENPPLDIEPETEYSVEVRAYDDAGNRSAWSAAVADTTDAAPEPNGLLDDLVAYWKLDEASGNAIDAHGANDLTDNATVGSATGKIGNARDFEAGNSEYFSLADNADMSLGADTPFTFAFWINTESQTAFNTILDKRTGGGAAGEYTISLGPSFNENKIAFAVGNGSTFADLASDDAVANGVWSLVICWHDPVANTLNIQIDNGTPKSVAWSGGTQNGAGDFLVGREAGASTYWDGLIDEIGFWKAVLTTDQRTALYNAGAGLSYDDFNAS